jgi:hypothetical protein
MGDRQEHDPDPEIRVTDRRAFSREGERLRSEADAPPVDAGSDAAGPPEAPEFGTFIMGLAKIALLHLGEEETASGPAPVDLPAAREMIDILGMLQAKTAGNLTPEERHLLDTLLYELRMVFTQKATAR